jgi:hypothetical protein
MIEASTSFSSARFRYLWPLFVLAAWIVPVTAQVLPFRPGVAQFAASGPRDTLFTLPVTWVVLDSVHVFRNGEPQSEYTAWRIAEPGNRIWVYRPLGPRDTLRIEYVYQPIPLARTYVRHSLREIGREGPSAEGVDTSRMVPAFRPESATLEGWSRLNKSGSLIRSVQIGTGQDLQLESALNLQLQGRVGKNVDVVAALTDQSTPIQPEGTTETLNELEKVYVSVRSPHLATTLGDYTLDLKGGQYDTYARKLTGVMGEANYGGVSAIASGAVSRGQFITNQFNGSEANQGPYPLHGRDGQIGIAVLAGTERVWLDGNVMRRGESNDYTIDYSAGQITFTPSRVITADSRIVVDFEYSNENYERFYGVGKIEGSLLNDKLVGTATFISESDDRTRPIGLAESDSDKAVLARAGTNVDSAVVFAADSVGLAQGDYVRKDTLFDTTRYSVFVFSPRDSLNRSTGQWRVAFGDFGVGNGDYEAAADLLGLPYFRWVGPQRGRYRPFRRLPLPQKQSLGDFRLHGSPITGLTLGGELALSQRDLNTFATSGNHQENGAAYTADLLFDRSNLSLFGIKPSNVSADGRIRHRDSRFIEMSRASEIEFTRDWDATVNTGFDETIREGNVHVSPVKQLTLTGGYGDLSRPGSFSSRRRTLGASADFGHDWKASLSHLDLLSSDTTNNRRGNWIRQNVQFSVLVGRFTPRMSVDREDKRDNFASLFSGFRYVEYMGGLGAALPANLTWDGEYRRRIDDALDSSGVFRNSARAYTATTETVWQPAEGGRTSLRYSHREKSYTSQDSARVSSDIGRLESLISTPNRLVDANLVYQIAKTASQNQILIAVRVPDGTGNYRLENGHYIPDDQGNYILVPRNTGSFAPATDLSLNSLISLRPDELQSSDLAEWERALSTETEIILEEQTRKPLNLRLLLLDQSQFRGDSTISGNLSFRQDVNLWRLSQKLALRLRYNETQSLQNQYLNGGQSRTLREGSTRVRARYFASWRGESEGTYSRETLHYGAGAVPDRDINRLEFSQVNTVVLSRLWEAGVDLAATEARDERTATQISLREAKPHAAFILVGKGRFDADANWVHAGSNQALIPFELGRGANRGENLRWSLRGTYQFGQNFSGSLNYTGRRDAGESTIHTGRVEVRATF